MADDRERQIRERAYRIWQDEGEPSGREQDHWSRAEAELSGNDAAENDELISDSAEDLPFGEPEDTGRADASLTGTEATDQGKAGAAEVPETSGIAAAAGQPVAPAPKGRKSKGGIKVSD
ncbi:DUF2934 domain-containing protein [Sphingomonas sp. IC4-52]|uniref:DUF2934 domain-containing protein n=1 Tax=Sphingomonas sp. IC4-52 TaxID=2887202 RepID=UPI001D12834D|nr:DUF2934 domain-containing protein [Sphingomonas sp. IC4-52]MCC2978556.1 DUF2934 domain-containing protein [Sphingomonas sp. IC4-52]